MRFLLTNDDGIDAPGMAAMEDAPRRSGEIVVVAPDVPLSECSHQVSTQRPIRVRRIGRRRYAVDGTPADCVRLGLVHLARRNRLGRGRDQAGGNLGVDVYLSGTVAAVREAALFGKPAVAFSHYRRRGKPIDWSAAAAMAGPVLEMLLIAPPGPGAFWNVNFPHLDEPIRRRSRCSAPWTTASCRSTTRSRATRFSTGASIATAAASRAPTWTSVFRAGSPSPRCCPAGRSDRPWTAARLKLEYHANAAISRGVPSLSAVSREPRHRPTQPWHGES